jgi:hypothetical protein
MRTLDPTRPEDVLIARRSLTRLDPVAFARRYLTHHITDDAGRVTFAECHQDWADTAVRSWVFGDRLTPHAERHAFFAPRNTGKSTWWLLILPLWAAAHGHIRFAGMFADTGPQAKMHLATFRHELESNERLREDFPELCTPARISRGRTQADRQDMIIQSSGFVMAARGMDSGSLGMKVGELRPDLLLIDDPEPHESNYSAYMITQRLRTLLEAVLPLNIFARVAYSGTVTMAGSIAHQMIKWAKGMSMGPGDSTDQDTENDWVGQAGFTVHHARPVLTDDRGRERSLWPARWPLAFLRSIMHTREYAKNYDNDPRGADGGYWAPEDFRVLPGDTPVKGVLQIDPAVTAKKGSDYTGLAVLSYDPHAPGAPPPVRDPRTKRVICRGRVTVHDVRAVKVVPGDELVAVIRGLLEEYPFVTGIAVESNQGGTTWFKILEPLGLAVVCEPATVAKEVRAADALHHYQFGRVVLAKPMPAYEAQACSFPLAPNDDMVDAANAGILRWLSPAARKVASEKVIQPETRDR